MPHRTGMRVFSASFWGLRPILPPMKTKLSTRSCVLLKVMPVAGHSANKKQPLPLGNIVAWFRTKMALATGILMVLAGTIHAQPVTNLPAFVSAVMQDNPVGYWRLNETNSTASGTLTAGFQGRIPPPALQDLNPSTRRRNSPTASPIHSSPFRNSI